MKKRILMSLMCILLSLLMVLGSCGKSEETEKEPVTDTTVDADATPETSKENGSILMLVCHLTMIRLWGFLRGLFNHD